MAREPQVLTLPITGRYHLIAARMYQLFSISGDRGQRSLLISVVMALQSALRRRTATGTTPAQFVFLMDCCNVRAA